MLAAQLEKPRMSLVVDIQGFIPLSLPLRVLSTRNDPKLYDFNELPSIVTLYSFLSINRLRAIIKNTTYLIGAKTTSLGIPIEVSDNFIYN